MFFFLREEVIAVILQDSGCIIVYSFFSHVLLFQDARFEMVFYWERAMARIYSQTDDTLVKHASNWDRFFHYIGKKHSLVMLIFVGNHTRQFCQSK